MSNGSEVLIYLSFLLKEAVIYLVAAATPNKHMVAMYQKLSFSDFILLYNSKNRHLEFLNLSPAGLISSIPYGKFRLQGFEKIHVGRLFSEYLKLGVLGVWMTFKKAEMAKTLRNGLLVLHCC